MNNLARVYLDAGNYDKALPLFEQTLKIETNKLGLDHPNTRITMNDLAVAYRRAGKSELAVPLLESALKLSQTNSGPEHPDTLTMMHNLAKAYREAGKLEQALPLFEQTLKMHQAILGPENLDTLTVMHNFALAYEDARKPEQAIPLFEQTVQSARTKLPPGNPVLPVTLAALGSCLLRQTNYAAAEGHLREALELRQKTTPDDWRTFDIQSLLGDALVGQQRYADAEPFLVRGHTGLKERAKKIPITSRNSLKQSGERLVRLYQAWAKPEQASEWSRKLEAEDNLK